MVRAVHPHGCGERNLKEAVMREIDGSSPRVWGTLSETAEPNLASRFIPTGVGNACVGADAFALAAVHPHGCGERVADKEAGFIPFGSSPRVWGTPTTGANIMPYQRFIPTGVGNAF